MLDESCPHHDRLKTLSIDGPEFHIYKSWRTEKENNREKKSDNFNHEPHHAEEKRDPGESWGA